MVAPERLELVSTLEKEIADPELAMKVKGAMFNLYHWDVERAGILEFCKIKDGVRVMPTGILLERARSRAAEFSQKILKITDPAILERIERFSVAFMDLLDRCTEHELNEQKRNLMAAMAATSPAPTRTNQ